MALKSHKLHGEHRGLDDITKPWGTVCTVFKKGSRQRT